MADESQIRWDRERRGQLGGAITLLFGLSSASLAFCGSLLTDSAVTLGGYRTFAFLVAVGFFVIALLSSVAVTVTRLQDARDTATIVRKRDDDVAAAEIQSLRDTTRKVGWWTWRIFYLQLFSFLLGAISLLIVLWQVFHSKLFP